MGCGVIVSSSQPDMTNRYTWLKPLSNGNIEVYEPVDSGWGLSTTIEFPSEITHAMVFNGNVDFKSKIKVSGTEGYSGSFTVGDYKVIVKEGIITKVAKVGIVEPVEPINP